MFNVNLIRGWQNTIAYRRFRSQLILVIGVFSGLLLFIYFIFFTRFLLLQRNLNQLSNRQYVSGSGHSYSSQQLTKALYGLKKLDQIKAVFQDYPEYANYHQFILKRILRFDSFTIDNYTLSKDHSVDVTLLSDKLKDILELLALLESTEVSRYFSKLEINSITSIKERNSEVINYKVVLKLQFNSLLLNEET